jgi:hypothetical protein
MAVSGRFPSRFTSWKVSMVPTSQEDGCTLDSSGGVFYPMWTARGTLRTGSLVWTRTRCHDVFYHTKRPQESSGQKAGWDSKEIIWGFTSRTLWIGECLGLHAVGLSVFASVKNWIPISLSLPPPPLSIALAKSAFLSLNTWQCYIQVQKHSRRMEPRETWISPHGGEDSLNLRFAWSWHCTGFAEHCQTVTWTHWIYLNLAFYKTGNVRIT